MAFLSGSDINFNFPKAQLSNFYKTINYDYKEII